MAASSRPSQADSKSIDLDDPKLYINRELSWLRFNARVLEEACDKRHPLLERVKFLSIFANNLDEFFMVRVAVLRRQLGRSVVEAPPDGMTPAEQLAAIRQMLLPQLARQSIIWHNDLLPNLNKAGIQVLDYDGLKGKQRKLLREYFRREIFPVLTPLAFDPAHPFPHISNLSINLAVIVRDPVHGERFARVKVPAVFPRLLRIPSEEKAESLDIAANLDQLFPGLEVVAAHPFRVTRDADFEIQEDEAADLLAAIEESVGMRRFGAALRLEVDAHMPESVRDTLATNLGLAPYQIYTADTPIGMSNLMEIAQIDRPGLRDQSFLPAIPTALAEGEGVFAALKRHNMLFYHPYSSFTPVVDFVREAARDPDVLAIKQTLYRVGANSPVVAALMEARENGKHVAVLVELKARFDEENNINWARSLEQAGVHVIYGLVGLKTHAKVCLIVRREADGIVRYVHMATGNYNAISSRIYADIGYLTCDPDIGDDVAELFNALTGYSLKRELSRLQDECPDGQTLYQGSLPGLAGGGQDRAATARDMLLASGHPRRKREHHRDLHRGAVPRA